MRGNLLQGKFSVRGGVSVLSSFNSIKLELISCRDSAPRQRFPIYSEPPDSNASNGDYQERRYQGKLDQRVLDWRKGWREYSDKVLAFCAVNLGIEPWHP